VAAGDGQQASRQSAAGELPSYVDCQTNIMRLTKQVAQTVQEMVSIQPHRTLCLCLLVNYTVVTIIYAVRSFCWLTNNIVGLKGYVKVNEFD